MIIFVEQEEVGAKCLLGEIMKYICEMKRCTNISTV